MQTLSCNAACCSSCEPLCELQADCIPQASTVVRQCGRRYYMLCHCGPTCHGLYEVSLVVRETLVCNEDSALMLRSGSPHRSLSVAHNSVPKRISGFDGILTMARRFAKFLPCLDLR